MSNGQRNIKQKSTILYLLNYTINGADNAMI